MIMDPKSTEFSDYINGFKVEDDTFQLNSGQYPNFTSGYEFNVPSPDLNFMNMNVPVTPSEPDPGIFVPSVTLSSDGSSFSASTGWTQEGESSSPSDESESTDPVLKYISQMLLEENMEDKPYMLNDYEALEDTEKSLYDVLGEQYPPTNIQQPFVNQNVESPDSNLSGSSSDYGSNGHSNSSISTTDGTSNYINHQGVGEVGKPDPSLLQVPLSGDGYFRPDLQQPNSQFSGNSTNILSNMGNGLMESSINELLVQNIFSDKESVLQFQRGFEEASKFLPSSNKLIIDLESNRFPMEQKGKVQNVTVKVEKDERENSPDGLRSRKNHARDEEDLEAERSHKQFATYTEETYTEESELSDMFDKVLLCAEGSAMCGTNAAEIKTLQQKEQANGSTVGKTRSKKQGKKKETVDLRTLMLLCAQAVSADDRRTAGELLKQIKEHSSLLGDGTQRLAHFFASGLEARLDGSGTAIQNYYASVASNKRTAADILKAYKGYLCACPFKKLPIFFANRMICQMAEKASVLHIVDFGILYGFQWPILIQLLSQRPGGPPKLRITGIEIPQRGFRPTERIEETGRRLENYCKRFNVPFEYNCIAAQNWEKIQIQEIKINSNEMLAVNSLIRFENLLDETAEVDCPRDGVLKLIRKMNPDIFIHSIINGNYNSPFFVTRFREALFHLSAIFDMFENTLGREDPARLMFEREFYGREAVNVVACEGSARVHRPETYKQWQVRTLRAGFKPLPLDQELLKKLRNKLKAWYHKDFVIDEDNHWMLQGWKGRILYGSCCWVPKLES
ncbi:hypothetical protein DITRI_Ditri05aG0032700 [Diplodiscus trichospermus]